MPKRGGREECISHPSWLLFRLSPELAYLSVSASVRYCTNGSTKLLAVHGYVESHALCTCKTEVRFILGLYMLSYLYYDPRRNCYYVRRAINLYRSYPHYYLDFTSSGTIIRHYFLILGRIT